MMTESSGYQPSAGHIRKLARIEHRVRLADAHDLPRLREIAADAFPGQTVDLAALQQEGSLFVAVWRTALDGFVVLLPLHKAMLVHRLAVAPDMRRRGIGGWLLDFSAHHARSLGLHAIEVQLHDDDKVRIAWLLRRGFDSVAPTGNRTLLRRPIES